MTGPTQPLLLRYLPACVAVLLGAFGCSASQPAVQPAPAAPVVSASRAVAPVARIFPVMLGIDVLEADGFTAIRGKRIGLLTHPAGVNRRGESTIDVLRRARDVKLVALFGPEHGIYGDEKAEIKIPDRVDKRTGLPVYSLYGSTRKPTKEMLKGLDALVIDLQDVGTRSYTYISAMRYTMEACFENGVEVVVLDRPNPLGGYKVDGPPLDAQWTSYVGAFRVPYVHGLTIAELARMAKAAPGVLPIPDKVREAGKLTVVPMRGWHRSMRWPDTGLTWVPTSPMIQDYAAAMGYPMTGLGTYLGFFRHGVGERYPFRGIFHLQTKVDILERDLKALNLPGIQLRRVNVLNRAGNPATGLYIEITDYEEWRPTEISFHLMKLACKYEAKNPFATAPKGIAGGFLRHMGSTAFFDELVAKGSRIEIEPWIRDWQDKAKIYQQQSRKYWLYY